MVVSKIGSLPAGLHKTNSDEGPKGMLRGTASPLHGLRQDPKWSAYAPGKEDWKKEGNYFTADELRKIMACDDMSVYQPLDVVLDAD